MSPKEVDELMSKRNFTLTAKTGSGIRVYTYTDITRTPKISVEVIPERNEFKMSYMNIHSVNRIETPWCSPIENKDHFRKVLVRIKKWARKIEELYEEE